MKKTILIFALGLITIGANAQTKVKKDENGNFVAIGKTKETPTKTNQTFTTKDGEILPIYVSSNNKFFVIRTSKKTNNQYKQYLTGEFFF